MRNRLWIIGMTLTIFMTGCNRVSEQQMSPLRGLAWFAEMQEVKNALSDMELIAERESGEGIQKQYLLDYSGATLFETDCDLTVCCTAQGFAGINYHDVEHSQTYREWLTRLEDIYGLPTEKGSGMASWYQNPVGKNTALYLFNLEEGIQVSFYAVSASPDKSYVGQQDEQKPEVFIPTPELRTPVVPAEDTPLMENDVQELFTEETNSNESQSLARLENENLSAESLPLDDDGISENIPENDDFSEGEQPNSADQSIETGTPSTAVTTSRSTRRNATTMVATIVTTAKPKDEPEVKKTEAKVPETQPPKEEKEEVAPSQSFLLNGLQFYGGIDSERKKMSPYTQLYEYRSEEDGQPWQLIMEYENVPYLNQKCDAVLCFTSLGLVGINYFDSNTGDYQFWVNSISNIYGSPNDSQGDYTAWTGNPVGSGTAIYIFALEDGVQVSFFADDTGSALS